MKCLVSLITIALCTVCMIAIAQSPFKTQQQFIQKVATTAQTSDQAILANRAKLKKDYEVWQAGESLHWWNLRWLEKLAKSYQIKDPNFGNEKTWSVLLNRVDIISVSLVVAQAANESSWGRSRFAREANNYFGQHCMKLGCGLVPKKRAPGEQFEVERFANLLGSIKAYMHMLNTKNSFRSLRQIRANLRSKGKVISGLALVQGLQHYSEHPQYISIISSIIRHYDLGKYDIKLA